MAKKQSIKKIPFDQVIAALLDNTRPFSPVHLHRFSDLEGEDALELTKAWPHIEKERKSSLMEDLEELNNNDTLVCFDTISKLGLEDPDPRVRAVSINLLWECDDDKLAPKFIEMLQNDPDEVVRASAASVLGMFVYFGELEEIPKSLLKKIETALLQVMGKKESSLVKRKVLEALGFSSHKEIPGLIENAFQMEDEQWVASALFAMGRTADGRWEKHVMESLEASDEILFEAVRAAGELELEGARDILLNYLHDYEEIDEDLRDAIVWSLSKIGGENVRDVLEKLLDDTNDEEESEFIQNALDNLEFTEGVNLLGMMDLDPNIEQDTNTIIDLNEDLNADEDDLFDLTGPSIN